MSEKMSDTSEGWPSVPLLFAQSNWSFFQIARRPRVEILDGELYDISIPSPTTLGKHFNTRVFILFTKNGAEFIPL